MNGQILKDLKPQTVLLYSEIVEGWWEPVDCDYLILFLERKPVIAVSNGYSNPLLHRIRESHAWAEHDKGFIHHPDFKLAI